MEVSKPCPFCGGTDLLLLNLAPDWFEYAHYAVSCRGCEAHGPVVHDDLEQAESAWDKRPSSNLDFPSLISFLEE